MANNESNEESKENEEPANEELPEGLTAEQAAEVRPYDEVEAWKKSKNTLFGILGAIALGVAIFSYLQKSEDEEAAERSLRFLRASLEEVTAEEGFLSFAEDYDDVLGGVAQYRAASIQYDDGRYAEAVENFQAAAIRLKGDPLEGRSLIGAAVSMLESEQADEGKSALSAVSENLNLLPTDRREARFLLGVQALAEENTEAFDTQRSELGKDENASAQIARLEELKKLQALLKQAKSLPEINLAKGADYLSKQRKRKPVKETESGLLYEVLKKGSGEKPTADDEVEVHYHGTLTDGQVFNSSKDRGEPAKFRVNQVISGWTEALQLMNIGAKWKLYIPADLAYGESGNNAIGPNEVLTFEVELLSITPPVPEPDLPDLNNSELIPAIFPEDDNASDANASK